jgi:positive regulator of sigma E activity
MMMNKTIVTVAPWSFNQQSGANYVYRQIMLARTHIHTDQVESSLKGKWALVVLPFRPMLSTACLLLYISVARLLFFLASFVAQYFFFFSLFLIRGTFYLLAKSFICALV